MLFNSYIFIFAFLPCMLVGYYILKHQAYFRLSKIFLVIGSLFFYGYWNLSYVPILLSSLVINFLFAQKLVNPTWGGGHRRFWLIGGITFNLGLLGFFKYTDFFLENINFVFDSQIPLLSLTLPLAISFFTFQQIAFLVDTYKSQEGKKIDLLDYLLFVTFFPQLIAGPIVHHKEMMPQFASLLTKSKELIDWEKFAKGLFIFSIGLFKKVVIADQFAIYANKGFEAAQNGIHLNLIESWLTSLSYTFQLYFDFSGYCDMAIGIALFFGIILPINFNSPYKASNIKDFWKRWHMTLGRFLTEYLYIPLGGNKKGFPRELFNLFVVFMLSGIWHGAGWGFIIWGALHASAMGIHRIYRYTLETFLHIKEIKNRFCVVICWILTFNFINTSWVFFRSENVSGALDILKSMIGFNGIVLPSVLRSYLGENILNRFLSFSYPFPIIAPSFTEAFRMIACFCLFSWCFLYTKNSSSISNKPSKITTMWLSFMMWYAIIKISFSPYQEFLYFNF
ncbi:MBOAT family O-acyltransferase [Helicobacter pametensis]|uniref:MBOAT family O-acyltransferase n=1 Tax=Helicobacter pametensis TaxID=95149 RepID=UPI00048451DA|nr:MBOAT family O-acyltransferase [Helicobacter pametensis]